MLNNGTIPPVNHNVMYRLMLGKTRAGKIIKDWTSEDLNGVCQP